MLRINRLIRNPSFNTTRTSILLSQKQQQQNDNKCDRFFQKTSTRFLDIYQIGNKVAIEKERARLKDEMNRGYFADIAELQQHGGKIAMANKTVIPQMEAQIFPNLEVNYSDGRTAKFPVGPIKYPDGTTSLRIATASLLCLSFRASSQAMIDSWTAPFVDEFFHGFEDDIQLVEVSFIDSWLLCQNLIKQLLLRIMRKSSSDVNDTLQKQIVYSFGDHYYFRKELKILNLLTGYIFLLDKAGRIRWQGSGLATKEELASLISCTSFLLEEETDLP